MRFKIDWACLIVGSKFTVLALLYFVFEGNFPSSSPQGAYIWRGNLTEGFLRYQFGGLIFGEAYFQNFTVSANQQYFTSHSGMQTIQIYEMRVQAVLPFLTFTLGNPKRPCSQAIHSVVNTQQEVARALKK